MKLTEKVAELACDLSFADLQENVRDRIAYLLVDYLGVASGGTLSDSSKPVYRFLEERRFKSGGVPVIATDLRVDAPYAALAMGTAAHSLELDDVVNAASLHPGVSVISAALAAGSYKKCSGPELMTAIAAGYEVMVKLGIALDPAAHYRQGFHPTATCGTMGAAVTAAKILKLDHAGMVNSLGIAGSQAAGSMEFLADGAFTKRFHAGWSAHSGLVAALLAREGFSGPSSIIEGKFGFLSSYSPASDPDKVLTGWGDPYEIMNTSIKPHACCRYKQGSIDCILGIMGDNGLQGSDIASVETAILKAGVALVAEPEQQKLSPASVVDAQFSMPFGAAVAIKYGDAFLDRYSIENIENQEVKSLMSLVKCVKDDEIEGDFPKKWPAKVKITTRDGREFSKRLDHPKGDPENPLSWDEIIIKFERLSSSVFDGQKSSMIVDAVRELESCGDVSVLMEQLAK